MNIAILGRGKTGSHVANLCVQRNIPHEVFHSENQLTKEGLTEKDILISFIPGPVLLQYIDLILEAKIPIISGSTGADFPENLDLKLKENKQTWIQGHNFSLGMNIVSRMIEVLGQTTSLYEDEWEAKIHEVHHTKKLDAPSGTALRFKEWFGNAAEITSERTGDVVGHHEITFKTPFETITMTHEAHTRALFAHGALWAAEKVLERKSNPGFTWFEELAQKELKI
jgi:4-hydroxy-tetrahydrodipicolinate reductase